MRTISEVFEGYLGIIKCREVIKMSERVSFKVKNNKFWILEQRIEEEMEAKVGKKREEEKYKVSVSSSSKT
jgi:hypothetical protein